MNPLLQKLLEETAAKRGVDIGGGMPPSLAEAPMSMEAPMGAPMPMGGEMPMAEQQFPIEPPMPTNVPDVVPSSPEIVDELSEAPVIMVDEIYMGIEDKVSALSPVEAIELATKILAMQIQ